MNKLAIVFLGAAISAAALACPQSPSDREKPAGDRKPPVTVTIEAKGSIGSLDTADRNEVQKYEKDLKNAGLTLAEVTALVDDEVQVRVTAKKPRQQTTPVGTGPSPSGSASASAPQGPGMGPYVGALLAQGLRGQELAAAIHAEQARHHGAKGHGKGPGSAGSDDSSPGKGPGAPGVGSLDRGKGNSPGTDPDRKGPPMGGKGNPGKPSNPQADDPDPRPRGGQPGKPEGGQAHGRGNKPGGKPNGNPKDENDDG
jgi:hypothetical protein